MAQQRFQAGLLDRKGTLVQPKEPNSFEKLTETTIQSGIYCQKIEKTGDEKEESGRLTAFGRVDFLIRYRSDVTEKLIWICDGIRYDIKAVQEVGRKMYLNLQCQKRD